MIEGLQKCSYLFVSWHTYLIRSFKAVFRLHCLSASFCNLKDKNNIAFLKKKAYCESLKVMEIVESYLEMRKENLTFREDFLQISHLLLHTYSKVLLKFAQISSLQYIVGNSIERLYLFSLISLSLISFFFFFIPLGSCKLKPDDGTCIIAVNSEFNVEMFSLTRFWAGVSLKVVTVFSSISKI